MATHRTSTLPPIPSRAPAEESVLDSIAAHDARLDAEAGTDHQYQLMQHLWVEGVIRQVAWERYGWRYMVEASHLAQR